MTNPCFRLIIDGKRTGNYNMEMDKSIFQAVSCGISTPTLRFYKWANPTVSLGYFQKEDEILNAGRLSKLGVSLVKRITGGKAVLHHREITYSLCAPVSLFPDGISGTYELVAKCLIKGLLNVGIKAVFSPPSRNLNGNRIHSCFSSTASYEITLNGKKIIGSAQKRNNSAFIQHGSILLSCDLKLYDSVFNSSSDSYHFTSITAERGEAINEDFLITNLANGFQEMLNIPFESAVEHASAA